jgi:hypothetical protein
MTIDMIALAGSVFVAAVLAGVAYERHMDVLHGSYIEGRAAPAGLARILTWLRSAAGASRARAGNSSRLAVLIAG